MFNEREIIQAVERIYDMFDEGTIEIMLENHPDELVIPDELLAQAIRDRVMTVYEYRALCDAGDCIDYHGKELFDQRAAFILSYVEAAAESDYCCVDYRTELWLLEDMSFAVVHAVITMVNDDDRPCCITEYRTFVRTVEDEEDIFFEPEDFICELDDICTMYDACKEATIYEL